MTYQQITILIPLAGVLALLYALWRSRWITKQERGNETMIEIANAISRGARAFLRREYSVLAVFVVVVAVVLLFANLQERSIEGEVINSPLLAVSFLAGDALLRSRRVYRHECCHSRERPHR